ncbi:MarR family transcriptional regulator [Stakelama sp. CBK3Z-3]|uniref:MarR family transcriptional regulator n=1 Tax=Stakelama flava TaxID=2860338 RepID=A0ABS6XSH3_9SPHN|nr:MarR family transcriptional regulator [Stakelama flava]
MASRLIDGRHGAVGAWAKRCYFAGRAAMETMLRPFDVGSTQWYILHQLVQEGPTMQRELVHLLQIERATLSVIAGALVRKGLIEQVTDDKDQRRKLLRATPAGTELWRQLPDLSTVINEAAFAGISDADKEAAVRVLRLATERLNAFSDQGNSK